MSMATSATSTKFTTRTLGNSDLQLTPIGYGAWAIGGGNWHHSALIKGLEHMANFSIRDK